MLVSHVMRKPVRTVSPQTSVQAAAALMGELNIGMLPVCENGRLVGVVTDRDIVVRWATRAMANGAVEPIMTRKIITCRSDRTIEEAAYLMSDMQIRRLVVLDAAGGIAGVLTLGDIANDVDELLAGQTLGEIVEKR